MTSLYNAVMIPLRAGIKTNAAAPFSSAAISAQDIIIQCTMAFSGCNRAQTCDPIDVNDVLYQLTHMALLCFAIVLLLKIIS